MCFLTVFSFFPSLGGGGGGVSSVISGCCLFPGFERKQTPQSISDWHFCLILSAFIGEDSELFTLTCWIQSNADKTKTKQNRPTACTPSNNPQQNQTKTAKTIVWNQAFPDSCFAVIFALVFSFLSTGVAFCYSFFVIIHFCSALLSFWPFLFLPFHLYISRKPITCVWVSHITHKNMKQV